MPDYILLMHDDIPPGAAVSEADWGRYIDRLQRSGNFQGGSEIGGGICARKTGAAAPITVHLAGFIRISAASLAEAQASLAGNPVFEAGGTVEIRELPRTE